MKIDQTRAFYWRVMMSAGQRDYALFARISVNHEAVIARCDHFIFFREQEGSGRVNRFAVCNAVEISRDLQGKRTCQQPEIPPAELAQDHLPQRRRILKDQSGDGSMRRHMQCGGGAETRAVEHNWLAIRMALQFVERGQRCRPDPRKARRTRALAESGIIHAPDLDGPVIPRFALFRDPVFRTICVAVEPQNVSIHTSVLLRSMR